MDPSTVHPSTSIFANTSLTILISAVLVLAAALLLYPSPLLKYLQRKRYQYEVTFSLYMMTPTEKFIFNSVLFLFLAMVSIAGSLYLPSHVSTMARRAYYYALGDMDAAAHAVGAGDSFTSITSAVAQAAETVTQVVGEYTQAAAAAVPEL